jgi:hypothetical protein
LPWRHDSPTFSRTLRDRERVEATRTPFGGDRLRDLPALGFAFMPRREGPRPEACVASRNFRHAIGY